MAKRKKPPEAVSGSYTPVPHALLDSVAFLGASTRAKALLFDLLRQHNGGNNGHLHLTVKWLQRRGWTSTDQIQKAKSELLERGLIIKTRLGGLCIGPDQYALTWIIISDFNPDCPLAIFREFGASCERSPRSEGGVGSNGYH